MGRLRLKVVRAVVGLHCKPRGITWHPKFKRIPWIAGTQQRETQQEGLPPFLTIIFLPSLSDSCGLVSQKSAFPIFFRKMYVICSLAMGTFTSRLSQWVVRDLERSWQNFFNHFHSLKCLTATTFTIGCYGCPGNLQSQQRSTRTVAPQEFRSIVTLSLLVFCVYFEIARKRYLPRCGFARH